MQHPLSQMFKARSVAVIGASDRNQFSAYAAINFEQSGYSGAIHMVSRRGGQVHGYPAATSCREIGEAVDAAFVCLPQAAVLDGLAEAAEAGIRNFVLLTSGFAEAGEAGRRGQAELVELIREYGIRLLGPNCLGFVNYADNVWLGSVRGLLPRLPGGLSLISVSGSVGLQLMTCAHEQGIGISHLICTGNEADIDTAELLDYLVADESTRSIAIFAEMIRDPQRFAAAAARALELRKPIAVLKVGTSPVVGPMAAAHTGALVGDDRVFDAVCRRYGIARVTSIEHLITTAQTMGAAGPLRRPGIAVVSISGGTCEIMADQAITAGVSLPQFMPETVAKLKGVIADYGATHNPIDITGAGVGDPALWDKVVSIVSADPQIGLTVCNYQVPMAPWPFWEETLRQIGAGLSKTDPPGPLISNYIRPVNEYGRNYLVEAGIPFAMQGMEHGMVALGHLTRWSERLRRKTPEPPAATAEVGGGERPRGERALLDHLARFGVPVIPAELTGSPDEAAAAARRFGGAVALKVASPDIAHKTDAGGVLLDLAGDQAVADGYRSIIEAVRKSCPEARIDGVTVAPMRRGGTELFVGIARDPQWGLVMAVGIGGIWVEALDDTSLHLLPVMPDELIEGMRGLRAAKLFGGYRGQPAVDLDAVAAAAMRIGNAVLALGPGLAAFEINPLLVSGGRVEALDALAVWTDDTTDKM